MAYNYSIGKYEITAAQYAVFLNAVAADDPYGLWDPWMSDPRGYLGGGIRRNGSPGAYTYTVFDDWANRPIMRTSWGDAARFANWLTNGQPSGSQNLSTTEDGSYYLNGAITDAALMAVTRQPDALYVIPDEDEWYKAAYHKNDGPTDHYWDYPTGTDVHPTNIFWLYPDLSNTANFYAGGYMIGPPYYRTPVGTFYNSESPYGTFDQGGNVEEWTETVLNSTQRSTRGGGFGNPPQYMLAGSRPGADPTTNGNAGFRIARVPEPSTVVLLALAAFARRRWRR